MSSFRLYPWCLWFLVALTLGACGDDDAASGAAPLIEVNAESAGENCEHGGQRIQAGVDEDGDGELREGEGTVAYICDGAPGEDGATGAQGVAGQDGTAGAAGKDGKPGVAGQDGDPGTPGAAGEDGLTTLLAVTPELPGVHCYEGGHRLDAGTDDDADGVLDPAEVTTTRYVCNGQDADAVLEIAGMWQEMGPWGGVRTITDTLFLYGAEVIEFDNDDNWVITQNPSNAAYNPGKFGKTYWTKYANGGFYYCTAEYALDTLQEARESQNIPDPSDLDTCGVGSWSQMIEVIEVRGRWHTNFGGTVEITSGAFAYGAEIMQVDNDENYVVTRNADDATYNPGKFGRAHWTEIEDGSFWYCTIEYDLDTIEEARTLTNVPDDSDPATGGCGAFSWTQLSPTLEIEGTWETASGDPVAIDSDAWEDTAERAIIEYDNEDNRAIFENPGGATPFNVVVWTEVSAGAFHYCIVDADLATLEDAQASTASADGLDLLTGCNAGPWTELLEGN